MRTQHFSKDLVRQFLNKKFRFEKLSKCRNVQITPIFTDILAMFILYSRSFRFLDTRLLFVQIDYINKR